MGNRRLNGRHILITGASSGIGAALAKEMAPLAPHLLLVARRQQPLKDLVEESLALGAASAQDYVADVTDADARQNLSQYIEKSWGSLDLLINNAGISAHGRFEENGEHALRQILEINFFAATELTRLVIPLLRQGNEPMIVNVGSILGHRGIPFNSEYCASKFALRGWCEALRPELRSDGIDLLNVSPGTTDTEFFDHLISKQGKLPWSSPKGIPPEEVAKQIIRGIERNRREIFPNWRGRMLVMLNRLFPRLVDRMMQRYG